MCGIIKSFFNINQDNATEHAPAAPKQCPVKGFVEAHNGELPKTSNIACDSIASLAIVPVPCMFIKSMSFLVNLASFNANSIDCFAPVPFGSGAVG